MHDSIDLSIVIVTWNSEREIAGCLNSIIKNTKNLSYEIVIVDNNSADNTAEVVGKIAEGEFNRIKLVINGDNAGFTKACNQGIHLSSGKDILLLNPDTKIIDGAITKLLQKLRSNEKAGAAAPQLLNDDLSIQKSCRTFPTYFDMLCELSLLSNIFPESKTFAGWKMNYFSHNEEATVEQPMAAALMVKKKVMAETDNLDERFQMFFNDVDLCKKIHDKGYDIIFYPGSKIIHSKGISIYKDRERMIKVWNDDCLRYFKKYNHNFFLYYWLYVSLKVSGYIRILLYKLKK